MWSLIHLFKARKPRPMKHSKCLPDTCCVFGPIRLQSLFQKLLLAGRSNAGQLSAKMACLLSADRLQTPTIKFQQMCGVILRLCRRSGALEADSGARGLAVTGRHGDKFHEVKRDIFVAAGT